MEQNQFMTTYQIITEDMVLFNDEYYVNIWKMSLDALGTEESPLFDLLFGFDHPDMELSVDVSAEVTGYWYLQCLVPAMMTPPDMAKRRMDKGMIALHEYLMENQVIQECKLVTGEAIYDYLKRYNPGITRVAK
ncbi:hypothetical protein [Brevibacillus daliensis]|uniref:hypothetical protein n=1 Tax=Brevibacillus daliensis TaxID=2892995 RepID=UPI001E3C4CD6|nr:hypothetical protein [Brevibacillus daliensis]